LVHTLLALAYHLPCAKSVSTPAEYDELRRSLFSTEEEESQWLHDRHEEEREYIQRDLAKKGRNGKTNVIIHYNHGHAKTQFHRTRGEVKALTAEEYQYYDQHRAELGIILMEYDSPATDQTFVTGPLQHANMQATDDPASEEFAPWSIDHVLQEFEKTSASQKTPERIIKFCMIDSGLFVKHSDLDYSDKDDPMVMGQEFNVGKAKWWKPLAPAWHGTHCAGIVCADSSNGVGTRGIVKDCHNKIQFMVARVFDDKPFATAQMSDVDLAVEWCADNGAHVINLSLASLKPSFNSMMIYRDIANNNNCTVVAAAGNGGPDERRAYPASYPDVISVGAIDQNNQITKFSQKGANYVAPGLGILSLSTDYVVRGKSSGSEDVAPTVPMVFTATPDEPVEGTVCDCGRALTVCNCQQTQSICVIERSPTTSVDAQVKNAEDGHCAAAIIYSADPSNAYGDDFNFHFASLIPCVWVDYAEAQNILSKNGIFSVDFSFPNFRVADGTSQAAPHIAAIVLLLIGLRPQCTASQIESALAASAEPLGDDATLYGNGLVHVIPAYQALLKEPAPCGNLADSAMYAMELATLNGEDPFSVLQKRNQNTESFNRDDLKLSSGSGRDRGSTGSNRNRGGW